MMNSRFLVILSVSLAASFALLQGQTPTGQITGLITDASGALVPEVRVSVTNVATGVDRNAASGSQGYYTVPLLPPGKYQVAVHKEGFRPITRSGITLNVSQSLQIDFILEVGTLSESVSIAAEAPLVQTADTTVNSVIENKRIVDLPLNGRSAFSLAGLAPGVNPTGGGATPHISGSQTSTSEVQIDGAVDVSPGAIGGLNRRVYEPQVDAVEEFSVQVNGLAAEYGRFAGGVINVVTKSGTNQLHGTAYDFLRNSKLDANNFFANRAGRAKSAFKRNQFGGTVGGPVQIPGLYRGRDKTFFFAGYEKTIARSQAVFTTTVPTAEWKAGDFSNLRSAAGQPIVVYDPLTGGEDPQQPTRFVRQPFQGNRVPLNRFDPVAASVLKYFPSANAAPTNPFTNGSNFVGNGVAPSENYRIDSRVDHNWNSKWRTFGRLSWGRAYSEQFNPFGSIAMPGDGGGTTASSNLNGTFDNLVTLSPNVLLNVRYGVGRTVSDRNPFGAGFDVTSIGLPAYLNEAANRDQSLLPKFTFAGVVTDLGQANTRAFEATLIHSLVANVTVVRARHNFKAGVDLRKMDINYAQFGSPAGQFNFSQAWTQQEISTTSATAGSPLASFLLGLPGGGSASHAYSPALSSPYLAVYAQDDWKLSRRLTLNLGLRYEIQFPRTERYNRMSIFDTNLPSPIAGKVAATACLNCGALIGSMRFTDSNARTQFDPPYTDFGPRAGLAFAVTPTMVIRAAYGIMFPPSPLSAGGTSFGSSGFAGGTTAIFTNDSFRTPATYLRDPFPNGFKFPVGRGGGGATDLGLGTGSSYWERITSPYVQQWNFNVQRSLPGAITIEAGYLGSRGVNLLDGDSDAQPRNQLHPSFMSLGSDLLRIVSNPFFGVITEPTSPLSQRTIEYRQLLRPFPQYTGVNLTRQPLANSIYHAFTLRVERRFSQGLSFLASFTGGKSIDDGSALAWWEGPTARTFLDQYNRRLERGVSSWDVSRRLVLSYVYELPFGKGKRFLGTLPQAANFIVGGWQVNGIGTFQTGTPLIIGVPQNNTFIYTQSQRANNNGTSAKISGGTRDERLASWFDTTVFSQPASFTLGNAGRTLPDVRNPGVHSHDLSLFKNNFLGPDGRVNLQYRLEMFSALNQPLFGGPATLVASPTFGTISGAGGSRQIQMALKLLW
jgi:hypothetical protein